MVTRSALPSSHHSVSMFLLLKDGKEKTKTLTFPGDENHTWPIHHRAGWWSCACPPWWRQSARPLKYTIHWLLLKKANIHCWLCSHLPPVPDHPFLENMIEKGRWPMLTPPGLGSRPGCWPGSSPGSIYRQFLGTCMGRHILLLTALASCKAAESPLLA
jgi:hypothetical protein